MSRQRSEQEREAGTRYQSNKSVRKGHVVKGREGRVGVVYSLITLGIMTAVEANSGQAQAQTQPGKLF